jgi:hypothetical protein
MAAWETPKDLAEQCREILGWDTDLALFPVRHHSPAGARHIEAWLKKYKPDVILIEGPAPWNDKRMEILGDPEHEAPFALIATTRDAKSGEVRTRSYYPMCDYSPELVAIRTARELGAECQFIDLVVRHMAEVDESEGAEEEVEEELGAAEDGPMARSRFTAELVAKSGCRDFDEVWEAYFEQAGWDQKPEDWAVGVTAYALLSRAGYSEAELAAEGTLAREHLMAWHMAEATKGKKKRRVAVVTGAFHTVALRETEPKKVKDAEGIEVFLAPYTFPRLDALLGYASGMSGPQFYQHVWDARKNKAKESPFAIATRQILVEAARLGRQDGEVVGTADAISALAFARDLASLRDRPHIGRAEVIEAAATCLVKGDVTLVGQRMLRALAETMRGKRVGKLGKSAGESALVLDFRRRCDELRIPIEHGRPDKKALTIFASDLDHKRSRFFHQVAFLFEESESPSFCEKTRGPDLETGEDMHLTIEHWDVQYVPEVDARLIELAHLGASVEDVATALLVKRWLAADGKSGELARLLLKGLVMGLHAPAGRLVGKLAAAFFADDDVLSLLEAGQILRTVLRARERLEAEWVKGLPALAQQAFVQGTLRLERLAGLSPDSMGRAVDLLGGLLDVTLTDAALAPSREMTLRHAQAARELARGKAPAILGALDGFLLQLGALDVPAMAVTFRTLARGTTRTDGVGAYLEGILAIARQALLGEEGLLTALIEHIRDGEWDDFVASLPSLRRAFTRLTPRETEAVAERAAKILGVPVGDALQMLGAPPEVVARLAEWEKSLVAGERAWAGGTES